MKILKSVAPADEQLKIISSIEPKVEVIRGAAGSWNVARFDHKEIFPGNRT